MSLSKELKIKKLNNIKDIHIPNIIALIENDNYKCADRLIESVIKNLQYMWG